METLLVRTVGNTSTTPSSWVDKLERRREARTRASPLYAYDV